eukprot:CAMPEP_0198513872 /NCGR_PEP_ID=MMETSP1462-20131121/16337_1 /TAXON_ID=1333877 /ORGANISM="Brandtodinium nutriculum, Strain RCC3387" /LENGTH=34 /DNA_ID= /DNA_START= /DNA_END= /DNA_ORIENTATION=
MDAVRALNPLSCVFVGVDLPARSHQAERHPPYGV